MAWLAPLLPVSSALASDAGNDGRPTIGLVLSGGGARGGAHVGVIRVLDELRIPVDFIAGTSMGAIVGGLYASGMDADGLVEVLEAEVPRPRCRAPTNLTIARVPAARSVPH